MTTATVGKRGGSQLQAKVPRRELKRALRAAIERDRKEGGSDYYEDFLAKSVVTLPITLVMGTLVAFGLHTGSELIWLGSIPAALQIGLAVNHKSFVYGWRLKHGLIGKGGSESVNLGELQAEPISKVGD